jgi:REP element-mobilizing transposase RayT
MADRPLAYFITFSCYGTWLHGDERGSVDREHNRVDTPVLPANPPRQTEEQSHLKHSPYLLDAPRRELVLRAICEVCSYRGWRLLVAHVRTNHVHAVVQAEGERPERVMNDFKAYASRALNRSHLDSANCTRWTRHGSTLYLWTDNEVLARVRYVASGQGEPMAVYLAPDDLIIAAANAPSGAGDRSLTVAAPTQEPPAAP